MTYRSLIQVAPFVLALTLIGGMIAPAAAQTGERRYIGLSLQNYALGSGFDGVSYFASDTEAFLVPEIGTATGVGLRLGVRSQRAAGEVAYVRGSHAASWMGATGTATSKSLDLNVKVFFRPASRTQPFLLAGLAFPSLTVTDGSYSLGGGTSNATYYGLGMNLGAGVEHQLDRRVALQAALIYAPNFFHTVKSDYVDVDQEIESISGSHFALEASLLVGL
jgi:opacity protein-like surface antigen